MSPLGLYRIVAPVLGADDPARRVVAVIVVYMDDSGTDGASPAVSIAGYVSTLGTWQGFERRARPVLNAYGVARLHAKEFHDGKRDFEGWSRDRKACFLKRLFREVHEHIALGVTFSAMKERFKERKRET